LNSNTILSHVLCAISTVQILTALNSLRNDKISRRFCVCNFEIYHTSLVVQTKQVPDLLTFNNR